MKKLNKIIENAVKHSLKEFYDYDFMADAPYDSNEGKSSWIDDLSDLSELPDEENNDENPYQKNDTTFDSIFDNRLNEKINKTVRNILKEYESTSKRVKRL